MIVNNMTDAEFIKMVYDLATQNAEHIRVLNGETGRLEIAITQIANDVAWLKSFFWLIAGTTLGGFISSMLTLWKTHKNGKH